MSLTEIVPNSLIFQAQVFSPEFCQLVIDQFEQDSNTAPGVVLPDQVLLPHIKQSTDLFISEKKDWAPIDETFLNSLKENYPSIQKKFPTLNFATEDSGYNIQRTKVGESGYIWHTDSGADSSVIARQVSVIWYLNDVAEGGETEFQHQGIKIKPSAGKMIVFPSGWTHTHRGLPPISNHKYIAVTWVVFPRL